MSPSKRAGQVGRRATGTSLMVEISAIAEILKRKGIEPAPERSRRTTWKEFLSRERTFRARQPWTQIRGIPRRHSARHRD
jgi:hypothetical protein